MKKKTPATIIVGASGDLGNTIARDLATDRSIALVANKSFNQMKNLWSDSPYQISYHKCDVTQEDDITHVIEEVLASHESINGLVYSAGVSDGAPLLFTSLEQWNRQLDINLTGAFLFIKAVARSMMVKKKGSIVVIGSITGQIGNEGQVAYAASKSGLQGLVKTAAIELAGYSVRVNLVAAGPIASKMTKDTPEKYRERLIKQLPLGRMGEPSEVAGITKYLLDDVASFVTGAVFVIDGGFTAK